MTLDNSKLKGLFNRVYNNKMEGTDKEDINAYIKKVFGDGTVTPDPSSLHQFNTLVVQQADEIAKPMVTDMLSLFATTQMRTPGELVQLNIPKKFKAKVVWSATGSGVDLVRVDGKESMIAVPKHLSTGFYYEPLSLVREQEAYFNELINLVAQAKLDMYLDKINELSAVAVTTGVIPANNVKQGSNVTIQEYDKIASTLQRYGGKPVFVADTLLIDHFANQVADTSNFGNLMTDELRREYMSALNITNIRRTTAVNLVNPFTDNANSKVELPVNKGYMFAGSVQQKPFSIVEYGGMRQQTEQNIEDERIKVKITQDVAIDLLFGQAVGLIEDDSITL